MRLEHVLVEGVLELAKLRNLHVTTASREGLEAVKGKEKLVGTHTHDLPH
jgi:hypothetical protein